MLLAFAVKTEATVIALPVKALICVLSEKKQELLTNPEKRSAVLLLSEFEEWLNTIKQEGMPHQNLEFPDLNTNGDGLITQEARDQFSGIRHTISNWRNLSPNELWIQERHKLSYILQDYPLVRRN